MHGLEYIVKANNEAARKGVLGKKKQEAQRKAESAQRIAQANETKAAVLKRSRG